MKYRVMKDMNYLYYGAGFLEAVRTFRAAAGGRALFEHDTMPNGDAMIMAVDKGSGDLIATLYGVDEDAWKSTEDPKQ